jgi:hypothetical protein
VSRDEAPEAGAVFGLKTGNCERQRFEIPAPVACSKRFHPRV